MSAFKSRWQDYQPQEKVSQGVVQPNADVGNKQVSPKGNDLLVFPDAAAPPGLPWEIESLVAAASSTVLPSGRVRLDSGLVPDINAYVMAWGCAYLIGDRNEALKRLWEAYKKWQEPTP